MSSEGEVGGTPRAVRARRREGEGRRPCFSEGEEGVEKREKASRISDSVAAEMLFSLASLDWRGFLSGGGAGAEA